jgi:hypothetical protein
VTKQTGAAHEQNAFIPAFTDRISSPPRRRRIGKRPGRTSADAYGRSTKRAGINHIDRQPPLNHNDSGGTDPARSSQKCDLAFQHAMRYAIARGLERPPQVGVVKDHRPLTAPRLFEPVAHASGCTSPALECAELVAARERSLAAPDFQDRTHALAIRTSDAGDPPKI